MPLSRFSTSCVCEKTPSNFMGARLCRRFEFPAANIRTPAKKQKQNPTLPSFLLRNLIALCNQFLGPSSLPARRLATIGRTQTKRSRQLRKNVFSASGSATFRENGRPLPRLTRIPTSESPVPTAPHGSRHPVHRRGASASSRCRMDRQRFGLRSICRQHRKTFHLKLAPAQSVRRKLTPLSNISGRIP